MEYTFKNSLSEKVQTIVLGASNLVIQSADNEARIAYASIQSVRLSKNNGSVFRITLFSENHPPISITNKYYLPGGECEDRSRQYTSFVRILHHHLKEKSSPVYSSGFSLNLLFAWFLISAFAAFFVSFVSEYLGLTLLNPFLQALVLTIVFVLILFLVNRGRLPKTYSPTEIPFQFLP